MSVNTELQNLLTKMGGSPLESDSNSDLIKKISNAYDGSGGGSGGSSGPIYFDVVFNQTEPSTDGAFPCTSDKTYTEIVAAYNAGKYIRAWLQADEFASTVYSSRGPYVGLDFIRASTEEGYITFAKVYTLVRQSNASTPLQESFVEMRSLEAEIDDTNSAVGYINSSAEWRMLGFPDYHGEIDGEVLTKASTHGVEYLLWKTVDNN